MALDRKEIDIEIARLEYGESSYPAYSKLADLYTIRNQMDRQDAPAAALHSAVPAPESLPAYGDSDFYQAIAGKDTSAVLDILDGLMSTLSVTAPRAYSNVLRKIRDL